MNRSSFAQSEFVRPLALLLPGIVLLIFPGLTNRLIFTIIGAVIALAGLVNVIRYFTLDKSEAIGSSLLSTGLITFVAGMLVIIFRDLLVDILPLAFGLILLSGGIVKLQRALGLKALGANGWVVELILAVLGIALGVTVVLNPFATAATLTRIVGAGLVAESLTGIVSGRIFRKLQDR